jgi:tetratricopeptide (TPR) repeat protein
MKRLATLCLAMAWTLPVAARAATNTPPAAAGTSSVPATNQTPATATNKPPAAVAGKKPAKLNAAQVKQIVDLSKQLAEAFGAKKYDVAKEKLNALLKLQPENIGHWYNLACAQSRLGEKTEAIASLEKAVEHGWADFFHLERDEDLNPLREEAGYKALVGRKDQIQRDRAKKINDELTRRYGDGCLHSIDDEHRLVFATTVDQRALDELRATLQGYADALSKELFQFRPERYVTVVVPKNWTGGMIGGLYNSESAFLTSRSIGSEMIHEFTHALHHADCSGRGQPEHPIWLTEGLATLYEDSDLVDGRAVPRHNHRLNYVISRVSVNRQVPWEKFMALKQSDFLRWPNYSYGQARYMMFYLHEQGQLGAWYRNYIGGYGSDTNGVAAWEKTLGKPVAEIEKDWCGWVQTLSEQPIRLKEGDPTLGLTLAPAADGLTVRSVASDGGGAKVGLKGKEVLTRVDGQRVTSGMDLILVLNRHKVGDKVPVEYRRGSDYATVDIELTPAPSPYAKQSDRGKPAPK